jgi:Mg2+-importing ATPase
VEPLARRAPFLGASLSSGEAARRLKEIGPNVAEAPRRLDSLRELGRYVANPLVLVLLLTSVVSATLGQVLNSALVALMVTLSIGLNFSQAYRSKRAVRRLREQVGQRATVVRDGQPRDIPASDVVPDDVIHLAAGDLVPADAELLVAKDLFVNEAALTGESLPSERHVRTADSPPDAPEATVFAGTSVVSGFGVARVLRTGPRTQFGHIAAGLGARAPETEFERGMRGFGVLILEVVVSLVLFVFLVNALLRRDPLESILFGLALAVGLTPELLPVIVSVTLASGAIRMARKRVVVKRLAAIEDFGSMDVLCSDKTGTLTCGEITVDRHVNLRGEDDETVIRLAALNSTYQAGLRNPMDEAILRHEHPAVERYWRVDEIPFDFSRRRVSVVVEDALQRLLIMKGAPESIVAACTQVELDGAIRPLDAATTAEAEALFRKLSAEGYRVLAIAYRSVSPQAAYGIADECAMTLVGFAAFLDPPREGAAETIAALGRDGVVIKILTGDNALVTERICRQVGLDPGRIIVGDEIDGMSDPALAAVAERETVFARISPMQKNRIVMALRSRGHVVGCLGDGINDAPALRSADVGISVDTAVDVAKDAADIILLDKALSVLHDGVMEGRRSFGNIMKYMLMGTSSNFGNMLSMAAASAFLPFLPMLPLQILVNNFLYDLSQVAIPSDRVDTSYLQKPRRWNVALIRRYMLVIGPLSSLFDFATFGLMLWVFEAREALFRSGWFVESLATQTLVIFVIRTSARPWQSRPSRALVAGVAACLATGLALPFTPLAGWLGFTPLPPRFFAFLVLMVGGYLGLVEIVKGRFFPREVS